MTRTVIALTTGLLALVGGQASAQVQAVKWDTTKAIIAGTGCTKDVDAFVLANGNDLAIVFTALGVDLPGGVGTQLSDRKNCAVRVPASIAKGQYIGELTQSYTYGVVKSAGSNGSISTRSTFFNFPVNLLGLNFKHGETLNVSQARISRKDLFQVNTPWYHGWCNPNRSLSGLYQGNLAVSGQRDTETEDLIMFVDGLDLKYEIIFAWHVC